MHPTTSISSVKGQNILIVEDEFEIANQLAHEFSSAGANVLGPAQSVERALNVLQNSRPIDAAVLNVNLSGELSLAVAEQLEQRRVRFVFSTGYTDLIPEQRYRGVPRLVRPFGAAAVARALELDVRQNWLLASLSPDDLALIQPHFTAVSFTRGQVLQAAGQPLSHVYFPLRGLLSVVSPTRAGGAVEVGMVGMDGVAGTSALLGATTTPFSIICKVAGPSYQIESQALRNAMSRSETLRDTLMRYVEVFLTQVSGTAASNARCSLEQRLARALLMAHDRLQTDTISMTHEYLALLLGVHRPGVTTASRMLEKAGAIKTTRGRITVVDRAKLTSLCGSAYGPAEASVEMMRPK